MATTSVWWRQPNRSADDYGHDHGTRTAAGAEWGRLALVLGITVAVLAAEIIGGLLAHSLVLIADAGHIAADAAGIGLSLLAVWFAGRLSNDTLTFRVPAGGDPRSGGHNAGVLFGVGALILTEAARRLAPETSTLSLTAVFGLIALVGNAASLALLRRGQTERLNVRGASLEVLSDLLGAVAVLVPKRPSPTRVSSVGTRWHRPSSAC